MPARPRNLTPGRVARARALRKGAGGARASTEEEEAGESGRPRTTVVDALAGKIGGGRGRAEVSSRDRSRSRSSLSQSKSLEPEHDEGGAGAGGEGRERLGSGSTDSGKSSTSSSRHRWRCESPAAYRCLSCCWCTHHVAIQKMLYQYRRLISSGRLPPSGRLRRCHRCLPKQ